MSDEQHEQSVLCMCGERMQQVAYQRIDYRWACPQGDNQNYSLHVPKPLPDLAPVAQSTGIDLEWALRELADGWIVNNEREGEYGFYRNARRVLTAVANDAAERQREVDAKAVDHALTYSDDVVNDKLVPFADLTMRDRALAAIRAGKQ